MYEKFDIVCICYQEGRDDMKKRPKPAPRFISIQDVKYVNCRVYLVFRIQFLLEYPC